MNEMKSFTVNGNKYDSFVDQVARKAIIDVTELPAQDINYHAFYRVTNVTAYFDQDTPHPSLRFVVVSKLPEVGSTYDADGKILAYYVVPTGEFWEYDDGRYTPDDMVGAGGLGWIKKTDFSTVDVITSFDGYEPTGNMIFLVQKGGLYYHNNGWIEVGANSQGETDDSNVVVVTYDNTTLKASMTGTEIYAAIKSGKTVVLNDGHSQKFMQFVDGSSANAVVCSTGLMPVVKGSVWSGTFEVMSEATDILFVDADGNVIKKNSSVTVPTPTYLDDNKVLVAVGDYYGSTKWVDPSTLPGGGGKDGVSATHEWNGTVLTITSASGTSSADLKGDKGDTGATPHIGANGNWWIGETDTGVAAGGSVGNSDIIYVTIDWDTMKASMTSHEIMEAVTNGKTVMYKEFGYPSVFTMNIEESHEDTVVHAYCVLPFAYMTDGVTKNLGFYIITIDKTGAVTIGPNEQIVCVPYAGTIWDVGKVLSVTGAGVMEWVDPSTIPALKGDKGDPGSDGKTPVKGTDYWTAADIAEIKSYVDNAILGGAW
jgi:hypothetical protein